jgi:hypothetical protein
MINNIIIIISSEKMHTEEGIRIAGDVVEMCLRPMTPENEARTAFGVFETESCYCIGRKRKEPGGETGHLTTIDIYRMRIRELRKLGIVPPDGMHGERILDSFCTYGSTSFYDRSGQSTRVESRIRHEICAIHSDETLYAGAVSVPDDMLAWLGVKANACWHWIGPGGSPIEDLRPRPTTERAKDE